MKHGNQEAIIAEEIRRAMEEQARRTYSPKVFELSRRPRRRGPIQDPNAFGIFKGICGDTMKIFLRIEGGVIREAGFETDGCEPTVASGSEITALAIGKQVPEAMDISAAELLESLGGLPEGHTHCALLAVTALYCALSNYLFLEESGSADSAAEKG